MTPSAPAGSRPPTSKDPTPKDPTSKQKVSLTLDADVVAEFERHGPLSSEVNEVLRSELERRRSRLALEMLVEELTDKYGPLDTPEDRAAVERYVNLLT